MNVLSFLSSFLSYIHPKNLPTNWELKKHYSSSLLKMRVRSTFFTAQSKNQVDIWIFSVKDFKASSSLWEPPSAASSAEDFHQMSDTYVEGCGSRKKTETETKERKKK